jgi:hypothetical protein
VCRNLPIALALFHIPSGTHYGLCAGKPSRVFDFGPSRRRTGRDLVQLRWTGRFSFLPLFFFKKKSGDKLFFRQKKMDSKQNNIQEKTLDSIWPINNHHSQ